MAPSLGWPQCTWSRCGLEERSTGAPVRRRHRDREASSLLKKEDCIVNCDRIRVAACAGMPSVLSWRAPQRSRDTDGAPLAAATDPPLPRTMPVGGDRNAVLAARVGPTRARVSRLRCGIARQASADACNPLRTRPTRREAPRSPRHLEAARLRHRPWCDHNPVAGGQFRRRPAPCCIAPEVDSIGGANRC